MKIWVVTGECGEYSDWYCWVARAFRTEEKAKAFVEECTKFEGIMATIEYTSYSEREELQKSHPDQYGPKYGSFEGRTYKYHERELR